MTTPDLVSVLPTRRRLLVTEDEPRVLREIECEVGSLTESPIRTAKSTAEFDDIVRNQEIDVVSIDWELSGYYAGPELLHAVNEAQPSVSRIVLTKHENEVSRSRERMLADEIIIKSGKYTAYARAIERGVRLTHARRIVACLDNGKQESLPSLGPGCDFDRETEVCIFNAARKVGIQQVVAGHANGLVSCLRTRGWWRCFDSRVYMLRDRFGKLGELASYIGIDAEWLGHVTGAEPEIVAHILGGRPQGCNAPMTLPYECDLLLSICAYLLEICGRDVELMQHYWTVENYFAEAVSKPPWDATGLKTFLWKRKAKGLADAVNWIRR